MRQELGTGFAGSKHYRWSKTTMQIFSSFTLLLITFLISPTLAVELPIFVDQTGETPVVSRNWSMIELSNDAASAGHLIKTANFLLTNTPVGLLMHAHFYLNDEIKLASAQSEQIADACKQFHPNDPWVQIGCLARSILHTVTKINNVPRSQACMHISFAFKRGFEQLNIPRSAVAFKAKKGEYSNHLFNRLVVTDIHGQVFAYVVDLTLNPNLIFPLTEFTEQTHMANNRKLPEMHTNAQ